MICTDSAWPVLPLLTISYCAVDFSPPEYPDSTFVTPRTCSKTPCTPQKQPPAMTAVCSGPDAFGLSTKGAGIATLTSAESTIAGKQETTTMTRLATH